MTWVAEVSAGFEAFPVVYALQPTRPVYWKTLKSPQVTVEFET
jgi:hypothetical protein